MYGCFQSKTEKEEQTRMMCNLQTKRNLWCKFLLLLLSLWLTIIDSSSLEVIWKWLCSASLVFKVYHTKLKLICVFYQTMFNNDFRWLTIVCERTNGSCVFSNQLCEIMIAGNINIMLLSLRCLSVFNTGTSRVSDCLNGHGNPLLVMETVATEWDFCVSESPELWSVLF